VDPVAVPLLGPHFTFDPEHEMSRAFMAARSRFAEDKLADAVAAGATQYAVLGAGLDTFAFRNPFPNLRVFEVDFPATQEWKRALVAETAIPMPHSLTFVPLDFEHKTLPAGLAEAGFNLGARGFFGWLGVVPYLTSNGFRATLQAIAQLPAGSAVCFDYALSPESMSPERRRYLKLWRREWPRPVSRSSFSLPRNSWIPNCGPPDFTRSSSQTPSA
jgi:methyltransferase (TIGR00027 family)